MAIVEWNTADRARQEGQRQQEVQRRAREEELRRQELAGQLGYWRGLLEAIGPAIEEARAEEQRLVTEKDAAYARYYFAYHRQTGGSTPQQGTGEFVLLQPMDGQVGVELPARAQWEAFHKAEKAAQDAHIHLGHLEADRRALEHNVALCSAA